MRISSVAVLCLVLAFAVPVCGADEHKPASYPTKLDGSGVDNLYQLAENLYSGSKPRGEEGLQFLAKLGIKTILSVDGATPDVEAAKKFGIGYVHIPISTHGITEAQAEQIVKAAAEQPGPLFVHCHYGMNRGPSAAAIIGIAQHDWSAEQAVAWMKKAGTDSSCTGLFRDVRNFNAPSEPFDRSPRRRIEARTFPSVFQAWNPATNMHDESPLHTLARHDLVWHAPEFFKLKWNNEYIGLADGFDKESVQSGRAFRQELLALNPNLILIVEIRYRDAPKKYLPEGHAWWLRDQRGRIVPGWEEGGFSCLDFHNPEFRRQVARQAKAAVASGVVDGVMLDWWSDDAGRLALVKEVREAIGDGALIICNANDRTTPQTARFINGYFMECTTSKTPQDWKKIADTLAWAEKNLRSPRVNCLETWFHQSRDDLHLMRATTTLALTHGDGYCLFSDPNPLPTPDHMHNWYPFWNKSLGRPVAVGTTAADGTVRREFDGGTVVYNPMGNKEVIVRFPEPRTSVATGRTATEHRLGSPDGDIYLMPKASFILGADISWVQEQEDQGMRFVDQGQQREILAILKGHGFNWIRLRVFYNPKAEKGYSKKGYCDLDHTLVMAKRINAAGMRFLLDFHYSDTWADPGHQVKPAAWINLHGAELEKAVHDYTRDVITALKRQGTPPDMVQIGNEISNGFLWPDGNVWKSGNWDVFCGLIKAGIAGAKEADPSVKIMLHLACGGQNTQSRSFLDKVLAKGVESDIIGQSYYSKWHGTLDDLRANLTDLAARYKQDIILVEYSVPNIRQINDIVHGLPSGKGLGTFIWEPTKWEGPALFDEKGNTKPEIDVYSDLAKKFGNP